MCFAVGAGPGGGRIRSAPGGRRRVQSEVPAELKITLFSHYLVSC